MTVVAGATPGGNSDRLRRRAADAELLHPRMKSRPLEPQARSGAALAAEHPATMAERPQYRLTLGRLERSARGGNSRGPGAEVGNRNLQDTPVRPHHVPL